jgi:hypothetical protein
MASNEKKVGIDPSEPATVKYFGVGLHKLLTTVSGVSVMGAVVFMADIVTIERFESARKAASTNGEDGHPAGSFSRDWSTSSAGMKGSGDSGNGTSPRRRTRRMPR